MKEWGEDLRDPDHSFRAFLLEFLLVAMAIVVLAFMLALHVA